MRNQTTSNTEIRILEAAEEEFLESGYDGARTVSIAEIISEARNSFSKGFSMRRWTFSSIQ